MIYILNKISNLRVYILLSILSKVFFIFFIDM